MEYHIIGGASCRMQARCRSIYRGVGITMVHGGRGALDSRLRGNDVVGHGSGVRGRGSGERGRGSDAVRTGMTSGDSRYGGNSALFAYSFTHG